MVYLGLPINSMVIFHGYVKQPVIVILKKMAPENEPLVLKHGNGQVRIDFEDFPIRTWI